VSGEVPEEACFTKDGSVFERRLIEKYIRENARHPVTNESLSVEDLIAVKGSKFVKPRPTSATSVPSLLALFQKEWDALVLESYNMKEQLETTRQELAHALYQNDAACRVIARLLRERDEAREMLSSYQSGTQEVAPQEADQEMEVEETKEEEKQLLPVEILKSVDSLASELTKGRKKRVIPEETASADDIKQFAVKQELGGHSGRNAGVLSVDVKDEIFVTGGTDKHISVLNVNGDVLQTLKGHSKKITSCKIAKHDGLFAVSSAEDKVIKVWDLSSYECIHTLKHHEGVVSDLAVHPLGNIILGVSLDGSFSLFDLEGNLFVKVKAESPLTSAAIHPDGLLLAVGTEDGRVLVWDIKSLTQVAVLDDGHSGRVSGLSFSENG
jgi:pre-mRNA-processing factor 19